MVLKKFSVRNGQSWDLAQVPLYDEATFREEILQECRARARLVNLFGYLQGNGDIRIFAILGNDNEGKLSLLGYFYYSLAYRNSFFSSVPSIVLYKFCN